MSVNTARKTRPLMLIRSRSTAIQDIPSSIDRLPEDVADMRINTRTKEGEGKDQDSLESPR